MNKPKFEYETIYNEDSFTDFAYVLYKCRGKIRKIIIFLFAFFFGINGILMIPSGSGELPTSLIMLLLCVLLIIYLRNTPKRLAKAMVRNSKDFDEYRKISFSFFEGYLVVKDLDIETTIQYSKLHEVVSTPDHLFLFTKPRVAYIITNSDISNETELQSFLEEKTGKQITILTK